MIFTVFSLKSEGTLDPRRLFRLPCCTDSRFQSLTLINELSAKMGAVPYKVSVTPWSWTSWC